MTLAVVTRSTGSSVCLHADLAWLEKYLRPGQQYSSAPQCLVSQTVCMWCLEYVLFGLALQTCAIESVFGLIL